MSTALRALLLAVACALVACASAKSRASCPPFDASLFPADVREHLASRDPAEFGKAVGVSRERLDSATGSRFPEFELIQSDGSRKAFAEIVRGPAALILLPTMNPRLSLELYQRFETAGWRTSSGRNVYFLVQPEASEKLSKRLMRDGHAFRYELPMPGFLGYFFVSPQALLVSKDLVLEGHTGLVEGM